MTVLHS